MRMRRVKKRFDVQYVFLNTVLFPLSQNGTDYECHVLDILFSKHFPIIIRQTT